MSTSAHFLLRHFDRLAEAPGGIAKLRALLLQLAVEGKLGTQNPKDEPAEKLRDRIAAEKKRLLAAGKLGRDKEWSQNEDSAPAFDLPASWVFSTLAEIGSINPRNDADDDQDASFVPMKLINAELRQPHGHEVRKWAEIKKGFTHFAEGDVTLAKITPCFENRKSSVMRGLANGIGAGTTELHVVRPVLVDPDYILVFLKSPLFVEAGIPEMTGTAGQKRVPTSYFAASPFPLPPLAEQRRIVAKVEELMGLCDALEAAQQEREAVRTRLRTSALHQLASPDSDSKPAAFVLKNLSRFTTEPEDLADIRSSVRQLVVEGKLSPQSTKSAAKSLDTDDNDGPYAIPVLWRWDTMQQLSEVAGGIQKTPHRTPRDNPVPYLGVGNVYRGRLDLTKVKEFELQEGELERWCLKPGDLLVIEGNGSITEIGRCALWNGEIKNCVHQNHIIRCRPSERETGPYILLFLNSPAGMDEMQRLAITSSGLFSLSVGKIRQIKIPLPPLAEQRRIVAKVDELMAVLDALEATLTAARTTSEKLLAATIAKLHAA